MKGLLCLLAALSVALISRAQELPGTVFQLGATTVASGSTAVVPVTLANSGNTLGAFAFYIATDTAFGVPTATPSPGRPDLVCFVDAFAGGVFRVTGFSPGRTPVGDGPVLTLSWTLPAGATTGAHPVKMLVAAPVDAIPAPNPESRASALNTLQVSAGYGGMITIIGELPRLTFPTMLSGGAGFRFGFTATSGTEYAVYGSTDLITWTLLPPPEDLGGGAFEFTDPDVDSLAFRFYRIGAP